MPVLALEDLDLMKLGIEYSNDLTQNSSMLVREQKNTGRTETQSFKISKSKAVIDAIDTVLAKHYKFSQAELDFIINYDIKFRLGSSTNDGDD